MRVLCLYLRASVVQGVVFVCDVYINFASLDVGFHQVSDCAFQEVEFSGHFDAEVQVSVLTDFSSIVIFLSLVTTSARPKPVMLFIIVFLSLSVY